MNRREIEDIEEESQAEILGLRPAIWLTHIQGELIAGKPDSVRKTTPLYSRFILKMPSFYQDRLRTHIGKALETPRVLCTKVVVEKFKEAGRPITLGFITYKPPDLQEYDQVRHNPTQPDKTIK